MEPQGVAERLEGSYWEKGRELIGDRPMKDSGPEGTKVWVVLPKLKARAAEEPRGRGTRGHDCGGWGRWRRSQDFLLVPSRSHLP